MTALVRLNQGNRVQAAIQLTVTARIYTDGGSSTARARDRRGSGAHGKCRCITIVSQVAGVPNDTGSNDSRNAVNRQEFRRQASHERAQVPCNGVDPLVQCANLGAGITDLVGKSVCGITREDGRSQARFHGF